MPTFPLRPAWVRISPRETDSLKCCYSTAVHAQDTAAVRRHGSNRQPGCEWAGFEGLACIAGDVLTPTNSYMSLGQAGLLVILDALLVSKVWGANRREDVSQGPAATGKPGIAPARPGLNTCSPTPEIQTFENNPQFSHPRCPQCRNRKAFRRCAAGRKLSLGPHQSRI